MSPVEAFMATQAPPFVISDDGRSVKLRFLLFTMLV
jgi:hypothetical protein